MNCLCFRNPTKGIIINHPNGPNVYEGVKIDYKAEVGICLYIRLITYKVHYHIMLTLFRDGE